MSLLSPRIFQVNSSPQFPSASRHATLHSSSHFATLVNPTPCSPPKPLSVTCSLSSPTAVTTTSPLVDTDTSASSGWVQFAERVSGEWDGFGADFTSDGSPVELPGNVVPEAFREWDVQVFDWQTQCPTLADPTRRGRLHYKLIRLLPTVGCEADAATPHTVREVDAGAALAFGYAASGSYLAVWAGDRGGVELEHCMVDPTDKEVRIRVVQLVTGSELKLEGVRVFSEQWYGPFRNGEQLGGCAVREAGFAAGEALDVEWVLGEWESQGSLVARFDQGLQSNNNTDVFREMLMDGELKRIVRDRSGIMPLPKMLWSSISEIGEGDCLCEVGWAVEQGKAVTSKCVLSRDGKVKEMALAKLQQLNCNGVV